jgi:hypothetical protein
MPVGSLSALRVPHGDSEVQPGFAAVESLRKSIKLGNVARSFDLVDARNAL